MVAFGLPFMGFFGVFAARAAAATGGGGLSSSSADGGSARLAESMAAERIAPGYGRAEQILGRPQKQKNLIFISFPFSHAPAFSFFSCVFLFSSGSVDIVGLVCRSACRFALPGWGPAVAMDFECGLAVAMRRTTCWPRTNSGGRLMVVGGKSLWFFSGVVIFVLSSIGGCQVTR